MARVRSGYTVVTARGPGGGRDTRSYRAEGHGAKGRAADARRREWKKGRRP